MLGFCRHRLILVSSTSPNLKALKLHHTLSLVLLAFVFFPKVNAFAQEAFLDTEQTYLPQQGRYLYQEFKEVRESDRSRAQKIIRYRSILDKVDDLLNSNTAQNDVRERIAGLMLKAQLSRRTVYKDEENDYAKAMPLMQEALDLAKENLNDSDLLLAKVFMEYGKFQYYQLKEARVYMDTSMNVYARAKSQDAELYDDLTEMKFYTYLNEDGSKDTLTKYSEIRLAAVQNQAQPNPYDLVYVMQDFADIFVGLGDYELALSWAIRGYNYAIENEEKIISAEKDGFEVYANSYVNLYDVLYSRKNYEEARKLALRLREIMRVKRQGPQNYDEYYAVIRFLGQVEYNLENYEKALQYFKEVLNIEKDDIQKRAYYTSALISIADCLTELERKEDALAYYRNGIELLKRDVEVPNSQFQQPYDNLGDYYGALNKYDEAFLSYDSALINALPNNVNDVFGFPHDTTRELSLNVILTIARKAALFDKIKANGITKKDLLKYGLNYSDSLNQILLNKRNEFVASEGKLFLSEEFRFVYESAMDFAYQLYQIEPSDNSFREGLKYARLSKSILYLEQSAEYEKVNNNILDQELKLAFSENKKKLDDLENSFYSLIDGGITSDSIIILNEDLGQVRRALGQLMDTINQVLNEANWQQYELIASQNPITIPDDADQIQVEYFYGEKYLYTIASGAGKRVFERVEINEKLELALIEVIEQASSAPVIATFDEDQGNFAKNASLLYKHLLSNVINEIPDPKKLVIVPDQLLARLPFEVLISEEDEGKRYDQMSFLMRDYTIRYRLSSLTESGRNSPNNTGKILGLGYAQTVNGNSRYASLPGTEQEINYLKASYDGTFINSASKDQFIELSSDYDIIHLAVHGTSDTLNKYDSRLIFSRGDSPELNTSDLYLAGLNARLAILSACESGVGAISKGEGTFSIARGFSISGVNSVVMSLWKVNDRITSELMRSMYTNFIDEGESINASLELAKRDYLNNADAYFAHPFYWASFIQLGDDIYYEENRGKKYLYWIGGLSVMLLFLLYNFYKKRKRTI
jgi:CHAT domain-containing protein/tetratricopeptide (TPR) repeat protein